MTEGWTEAAPLASVPQDDVIAVDVGGREIALYGVDGEIYATDNPARMATRGCATGSSTDTRSNARCIRASSTSGPVRPCARR